MGVVYKAEDTRLHRPVAIKALSVDLIGDAKARARFMREARAASSVDHPNICTVYEINEADETLFFVMQCVEGKTLKKYIGGRPLSLDQAVELSLQLTDALAEAHHKNVIHRDIKSSNIMVNERGQAIILDFGLAKLLRAVETEENLDLTQAGTPFGTASYMAPEQARGEGSDARSDIFSLGVVVYEMLTGHVPFRGKSSVDVMHAVMHKQPESLGESIPAGLQRVVLKALSKEPATRYQSAEFLLEDLRSWVRTHYAEAASRPADKSALLHVSSESSRSSDKGLLSRFYLWLKRLVGGKHAAKEESAGDVTPSSWQSGGRKAIAILPFKNISGDSDTEFYSFSLADSVITELAQMRDLIVRPSSYIAQYQNKDIDPRAVGQALSVDAVLVCGYLKSGDRFRVTPQLVEVKSGEILWSEKIDVDARDIITVQDTISREIVHGLRVSTSSGEHDKTPKTLTENVDAYEHYLKGRTLLHKFTTQTLDIKDLEAAAASFQAAVELDPEFAHALSGLGLTYITYVLKGIGGREYCTLAKECLEKALAIVPGMLEPRVKLVYIDLIEGQADRARREVRRLLKTAPNESSVHSMAAYVHRLSGQYDAALEEWDYFLKINPTDVVYARYNRARIHIYRSDYDKAEEEIQKGLMVEPGHALLRAYGALIDFRRGDLEKAIPVMEDVMAKNPELHSYRLFLAYCLHARGERERAFELIDEQVRAIARVDQDVAYWLASLYAMDGRASEALEWLELAVSMGNENYPWFAADQTWALMTGDLRYRSIMEELRLRWERVSRETDDQADTGAIPTAF